jgi:protein-S-isoprenylcysteine O-methyltransferase Ste14
VIPMDSVMTMLDSIDVPSRAGVITGRYLPNATARGLVVCIQNLHQNYGVQCHIIEICDHIAAKYPIRLMCAEGAEGSIEFKQMHAYPDPEVRREAALFLLKRGLMPGSMAFAVLSSFDDVDLIGVDNNKLHSMNMEAGKAVAELRKSVPGIVKEFRRALLDMYGTVVSNDLRELVRLADLYDDNTMLDEYTAQLLWYARLYRVRPRYPFGVLSQFAVSKDDAVEAYSHCNDAAAGHPGRQWFECGLSPDFDDRELFRELCKLLSITHADRCFAALSTIARLLDAAFQGQLTSDEARYFLGLGPKAVRNECVANIDTLNCYVKSTMTARNSKALQIGTAFLELLDSWDVPAAFYRAAKMRSHAIASATAKAITDTGKESAFLVLGGFQSVDTVKDLVRNHLCACVVVTPHVHSVESPYWDSIAGKTNEFWTEERVEHGVGELVALDKTRLFAYHIGASVLLPVALLMCAGTASSSALWRYLVIMVCFNVINTSAIRVAHWPEPQSYPGKFARHTVNLLSLATLVTAAVDVGRLHWSPEVTQNSELIGLGLYVAGSILFSWSLYANTFYFARSDIIDIPGWQVIKDGPYRFVRHPGALGSMVRLLSSAFAIGSYIAIVPALLGSALWFWIAAREDGDMASRSPAYKEYTVRVPRRFVPKLW